LLFKCAPQRTAAAKSCLSYAVPLIPGSVLKRVSSANVALSANMCGRRLIDKSFFTLMQHWSGAVMCPAC
jgi:hypothetical protein